MNMEIKPFSVLKHNSNSCFVLIVDRNKKKKRGIFNILIAVVVVGTHVGTAGITVSRTAISDYRSTALVLARDLTKGFQHQVYPLLLL